MQKVCVDRYQQFGTAGNGSKIKQISLEDFAARYAKGELMYTKEAACVIYTTSGVMQYYNSGVMQYNRNRFETQE